MVCRACGLDHSPLIRCEVFRASKANDQYGMVEKVSADGDSGDEKKKALGKSANGRERSAYNAYQREYMRAYRKRRG